METENSALKRLYFKSEELLNKTKQELEDYIYMDFLAGNLPTTEERIHLANMSVNHLVSVFGRSWMRRFQLRIKFINENGFHRPKILVETKRYKV